MRAHHSGVGGGGEAGKRIERGREDVRRLRLLRVVRLQHRLVRPGLLLGRRSQGRLRRWQGASEEAEPAVDRGMLRRQRLRVRGGRVALAVLLLLRPRERLLRLMGEGRDGRAQRLLSHDVHHGRASRWTRRDGGWVRVGEEVRRLLLAEACVVVLR